MSLKIKNKISLKEYVKNKINSKGKTIIIPQIDSPRIYSYEFFIFSIVFENIQTNKLIYKNKTVFFIIGLFKTKKLL